VSSSIEDYALVGDCRSAALVSKTGSIDWWSVPRFDSQACFAALLGDENNGRWLLAPSVPVRRVTRHYRGASFVLETLFETDRGNVAVIDCMPLSSITQTSQLVRRVEGRTGRVPMHMEVCLRFEYGKVVPWVTRQAGSTKAIAGPHALHLYGDEPLRGENLHTVANFEVAAGAHRSFAASYHASHEPEMPPIAAGFAVARTEALWAAWSERSRYHGRYHEAVQRSLLVLKALTYEPTGGIVAAPTTSLPEQLGGERNWDYRYCWLRDATITLYALLLAGYTTEAVAWRQWLLRAVAGSREQLQIMYGLSGERELRELELPWLAGYQGAKPVRVGNAAHAQLQLDVFGELLDAMHQCRRMRLEDPQSWALESKLLGFLEAHWQDEDASIWEVRGPARHFTYSKMMAWVAFDRAVKAIELFGCKGPLERWRALRDRIHAEVCARAFDRDANAFVQSYGSKVLDASLLQMPLVGFLPADDPRVRGTVAAIERTLLVDDTFVLRYRSDETDDGLPAGEGAFLPCSFWLVSNRVMQGRADEARALFERVLSLANDVGLLAEEYDVPSRRQVGNFPQAFSHLALVDAAQALSEVESPAQHRLAPERSAAETDRAGAQEG
jgi:GH15 family glucan-1,4-alpha-glucosidase